MNLHKGILLAIYHSVNITYLDRVITRWYNQKVRLENMGVNSDYFSAAIHYLSAVNGESPTPAVVKGMDAFEFHCPFCNHFVQSDKSKRNKTAKLTNASGDTWIFTCSRGFSPECRGGHKSFYNFLLLLHPDLHHEYKISLGMTDARNHQAITNYKKSK